MATLKQCDGQKFVRLKWADVSEEALTIFDGKGRPGQGPLPHRIPLLQSARADLTCLSRKGEFAITTTAGKKAISVRTLAGWAHAVVGDSVEGFQLKRIRSGVETLLAANEISREAVRGHLHSHGLSGVQARHDDGHDYMREKRIALESREGGLPEPQRCVKWHRRNALPATQDGAESGR